MTTITVGGSTVSDAAMAASVVLPFAFTLLFVMSIFITSGYLLQSVTEEKENRVVEILLSSVPSLPLMAGKILGLGAAGLTQVAIWIGASLLFIPIIGGQVGGLGDLHLSAGVLAARVRLLRARLPVVRRHLHGHRRPRAGQPGGAAVLRASSASSRSSRSSSAACS